MITEDRLNAIFDSPLYPVVTYLLPIVLLALCVLWAWRLPVGFRVLSILFFAVGCLGLHIYFFGVGLAWVLRDGLGPDSVESHGAEAVARFMECRPYEIWPESVPFLLGVMTHLAHWAFRKDESADTSDRFR